MMCEIFFQISFDVISFISKRKKINTEENCILSNCTKAPVRMPSRRKQRKRMKLLEKSETNELNLRIELNVETVARKQKKKQLTKMC